ncbi:MAG: hypothetical protein JRJ82_19855 [Deltaproteobacteria bacterium]|nr:hypothetical protein [Deltaproteobacteria bacterium]
MKVMVWPVVWAMLLLIPQSAIADLNVVREVTVAPKNGRVVANIGSVNQSYNIRMEKALVEIAVGKMPERKRNPVVITVHAAFTMVNDAPEALALTVGFPVSNSRYSSFEFDSFVVETDGSMRSVFKRVTGYPRNIKHRFVSGPDREGYTDLPDYPELGPGADSSNTPAIKRRKMFATERIGPETFQNLMVWRETFEPGQTRIIKVRYAIQIPLQKNAWKQKKVEGNYKGIWPQEANNLPLAFLKTIPRNEKYYFFDYYLTSGASWKDTIGDEVIQLRLHDSWQGHELFSNYKYKLVRSGTVPDELTYTYILRNAEPAENLYFALARP